MWIKQFINERSKKNPKNMIKYISEIVEGVTPEHYKTWGATGIHATLYNKVKREFHQDFHIEVGERTFHFLNPSSPGWTSALAMADDWVDRVLEAK
jgi:L-2-hydroxyglutarate oxidase